MINLVRAWFRRLTRRPDIYEWGLIVAMAVSTRGDCSRRKVGAVILDKDSRICGAGYNGTYRGAPGCLEGACPRGRHYPVGLGSLCECGNDWPCPDAVPSGSSYDTGPGACIAVHAELNALLDVSDKGRLESSTMFITAEPCDGCRKILSNTQIYRLIWINEDGDMDMAVWPFAHRS